MSQAILQITPSWGNNGRRVAFFAIAAENAGYRSYVLYGEGEIPHPLLRSSVDTMRLSQKEKKSITDREIKHRLSHIIKEHNIKLVHIHQNDWSLTVIKICEGYHIPWIVDVGSKEYKKFMKPSFFPEQWKKKWQKVLDYSKYITYQTDVSVKKILLGHKKANVKEIPHEIDLKRYNPAAISVGRVVALNEEWRLQDGVKVILLVGPVDKTINYPFVIEAIHSLKEHLFVCLVINEPYLRHPKIIKKLYHLVAQKKLQSHIDFVKQCLDLPTALMLADLVLIPSSYEGSSYIYLQAQAMGKPVLLGNEAIPKSIVNPKSLSYYFIENDEHSLSKEILHMLKLSTGKREKYIKQSRSYVEKRFDNEEVAKTLIEFYQSVMGVASHA